MRRSKAGDDLVARGAAVAPLHRQSVRSEREEDDKAVQGVAADRQADWRKRPARKSRCQNRRGVILENRTFRTYVPVRPHRTATPLPMATPTQRTRNTRHPTRTRAPAVRVG